MNKHTPEPWRLKAGSRTNMIEAKSGRRAHPSDDGWRIVATYQDACESFAGDDVDANLAANGRRIVACVNACAGISTDALENNVVADLLLTCKALVADCAGSAEHWDSMKAARAVIAKAEGGA